MAERSQLLDGSPSTELLALQAAVDGYLTAVAEGLHERSSNADVVAELQGLERVGRMLPVAGHSLITTAEARSLPALFGSHGVSGLLQELLLLSPYEAKCRVGAARNLGRHRDSAGVPVAPVLPMTAGAQLEGDVSPEQARVIGQTLELLPQTCPDEDRRLVEKQLVETATKLRPRELGILGRQLVAELDHEGVLSSDAEHERHRSLSLIGQADGSYRVFGRLTPACGAQLLAWLTPRSAPLAGENGESDRRTATQRNHDALADLAGMAVRRDELEDAQAPAQVVVLLTATQLIDRRGWAQTSFGQLVSVPDALRLADEAALTFLVRAANGAILAEGRSKRIATRAQTLALIGRDRGCSFPSCDRPPEWTQRHHVIGWADGGRTDIDNLTLLCGAHHRSFERAGWQCRMQDGLPWWIPPRWLDPEQRPRLNPRIERRSGGG